MSDEVDEAARAVNTAKGFTVTEHMNVAGSSTTPLNVRPAEKAVDAAIAEFNALRTEIITTLTAQATFSGIAFTAIGLIFGYALNRDGNASVAIAIPFISALTISMYAGAALRISSLGSYIRSTLWPYIQSKTDESIPSWESSRHEHRASSGRSLTGNLTGITVGAALFILGIFSAFATPRVSLEVRCLAAAFLAITTSMIVILLLHRRRDPDSRANENKASYN